jgi:acetate kinase
VRAAVCRDLDALGIVLDGAKNEAAAGEARIDAAASRVQLWIMPTNEEVIVARQTKQFLESQ